MLPNPTLPSPSVLFPAPSPDSFVRSGVSGVMNASEPFQAMPSPQEAQAQWYVIQGDRAYQENRFPEALTAFNRAVSLNGQDYRIYNKRGVVYAAMKNYPAAMADYTMALSLNPSFYNAYINRGNLWVHVNDTQRALADYTQAIRINPANRAAYENRSELYSTIGQHRLAAADKAMLIRMSHTKAVSIPPVSTTPPPRFALVLANDDYPGQANDLEGGPLQDARDISEALQVCGFQVMRGNNLTGPQTRERIAEFVQLLKQYPGAVSLIYYSGHGGSMDGTNYLIPINFDGDADQDFRRNAVSVDYMLHQLKNANSAFNMIFLDACRTPLPHASARFKAWSPDRHMQTLLPTPVISQWETEPGPGLSNTWIEYASRPEQPALQAGGRGIYTKYLLYYLMQPNLSLEDVSMLTSYALEQDPEANLQDQHSRTQTDLSKTEAIAESFYFRWPTPLPAPVSA